MLKVRLIPILLHKDFGLVKGVGFDSWRRVGSAMQTVKIYNMRNVDELIFLDITATEEGRRPDFELIDELADECCMPLTVGGGIRSIEDIRNLLLVGADKISLNTVAVENPSLIKEGARYFGSQCIVVSVDYVLDKDGVPKVVTHSGKKKWDLNLYDWVKKVEALGAGELLLTSITHDGSMKGYDLEIIKKVSGGVSIPVIASGGAGTYEDMYQVLIKTNASAIAASSIFYFTEQTPNEAKKYLYEKKIAVRYKKM